MASLTFQTKTFICSFSGREWAWDLTVSLWRIPTRNRVRVHSLKLRPGPTCVSVSQPWLPYLLSHANCAIMPSPLHTHLTDRLFSASDPAMHTNLYRQGWRVNRDNDDLWPKRTALFFLIINKPIWWTVMCQQEQKKGWTKAEVHSTFMFCSKRYLGATSPDNK